MPTPMTGEPGQMLSQKCRNEVKIDESPAAGKPGHIGMGELMQKGCRIVRLVSQPLLFYLAQAIGPVLNGSI